MSTQPPPEQIEYHPIRYLDPNQIELVKYDGSLRLIVAGQETHDRVLAYACFPISNPRRFISLRVGVTALEQREVGMIRDLGQLKPEHHKLLEEALAMRYFVHEITEIHRIREEFGYLYWEVETDKGRREFPVHRWDQNRVREFTGPDGEVGWTIIDADKNRYEIPDISALDSASRAVFYSKIHWGTQEK